MPPLFIPDLTINMLNPNGIASDRSQPKGAPASAEALPVSSPKRELCAPRCPPPIALAPFETAWSVTPETVTTID
jgi:hypothetical protein